MQKLKLHIWYVWLELKLRYLNQHDIHDEESSYDQYNIHEEEGSYEIEIWLGIYTVI